MRTSPALIAVALLSVLTAAPPVRSHDERLRTEVERKLSGIDYLPDHSELTGDLSELLTLAASTDPSISPGVRIRALRSLGLFDDDQARASLTAAIVRYRNSDLPTEQLYLIAALEALGAIADVGDVPTLSGSLAHDRRDVRAAAARALGATLEQSACSPLQTQRAAEPEGQVRVALDDALSSLGSHCAFGLD